MFFDLHYLQAWTFWRSFCDLLFLLNNWKWVWFDIDLVNTSQFYTNHLQQLSEDSGRWIGKWVMLCGNILAPCQFTRILKINFVVPTRPDMHSSRAVNWQNKFGTSMQIWNRFWWPSCKVYFIMNLMQVQGLPINELYWSFERDLGIKRSF